MNRQMVIGRPQSRVPRGRPILGAVQPRLPVLNPGADGKRLGLHGDFHLLQHGKGIPGAVPHRQHHMPGGNLLFLPATADPHPRELALFVQQPHALGLKAHLASPFADRLPDIPHGLGQNHKHLPEMQKICGLDNKPVFTPIVDDYYKGMATTVPLHMSQLNGVSTLAEVRQKLADYYGGQTLVRVADTTDTAKLYANAQAGKDTLVLYVAGNDEQFTVTALFDNLGKGASGAAVQNMNLMLGLDETTGLNV